MYRRQLGQKSLPAITTFYTKFAAVPVEAIKELRTENESLKKRMAILEKGLR